MMAATPFSLEEAIDIAEDFEDLIDTDFGVEGTVYEVVDVMVCPHHDEDQKVFFEQYTAGKNKEAALGTYSGDEYDVAVFACDLADPEQYTCIDIRTFAEQRGIKYNYPGPGK